MSTLVAVVFDDEITAFEMRAALLRMQTRNLIDLEDSVVVTRDQRGSVRLDQATTLTAAGAVGGGMWGMLLGLLFLNPLLGAAIGAAAGGVAGRYANIGVDEKMVRDVGKALKFGGSALFVLVRRATVDKVLEGLQAFAGRGKVFETSLSVDDEAALRKSLEEAA